MPREAAAYLEEASADSFPFRLVEMARRLTAPLVLVLDNAHALDDRAVVAGLDVVIRHAPPTLCVLLAGRHAPGISLDRLRAYGELATVGAADLACTPGEADAYLAMAGAGFPRPSRDELSVREKCFISELRPAANYGAATYGAAARGARRAGRRRAAGLGPGAAPPERGEAPGPARRASLGAGGSCGTIRREPGHQEAVMFRRRRPLLRAAAVGGGAYIAGKSVARRRAAAGTAGGRAGRAARQPGAAAGPGRSGCSGPSGAAVDGRSNQPARDLASAGRADRRRIRRRQGPAAWRLGVAAAARRGPAGTGSRPAATAAGRRTRVPDIRSDSRSAG